MAVGLPLALAAVPLRPPPGLPPALLPPVAFLLGAAVAATAAAVLRRTPWFLLTASLVLSLIIAFGYVGAALHLRAPLSTGVAMSIVIYMLVRAKIVSTRLRPEFEFAHEVRIAAPRQFVWDLLKYRETYQYWDRDILWIDAAAEGPVFYVYLPNAAGNGTVRVETAVCDMVEGYGFTALNPSEALDPAFLSPCFIESFDLADDGDGCRLRRSLRLRNWALHKLVEHWLTDRAAAQVEDMQTTAEARWASAQARAGQSEDPPEAPA